MFVYICAPGTYYVLVRTSEFGYLASKYNYYETLRHLVLSLIYGVLLKWIYRPLTDGKRYITQSNFGE